MDTHVTTRLRRRTVLGAAGLVAAQAVLAGEAQADILVPETLAQPGEFDFLSGDWRIAQRRETAPGVWDEFEGEATCWSILGGRASVEELRIPARDFSGMGLRTLDAEKGVWLDYWMNAKAGVVGAPGAPGRFIDGVGNFDVSDAEDGKPVIYRGCWDQITASSCRWRQGVSRDRGTTWAWNWIMNWTRKP